MHACRATRPRTCLGFESTMTSYTFATCYSMLCAGLGGSVLESKLHNVTQPHTACSGDHDWQVSRLASQVSSDDSCIVYRTALQLQH